MREMMRSPMIGVLRHRLELLARERRGLVEDVAGDPDLADVVQHGGVLEHAQLGVGEPHAAADGDGHGRQRVGVRGRVLVLGLHGGGQRGHRLEVHAVELVVGLGVLQGDGDLAADGGEQRELLGAELARVAEAHGERADHALLARERDHEEAAQLVRRPRERAQVLVGLGVEHLEAAAVLDDPDGELVRGRRGHGTALAAAEGGPRRVTLVDEEHARAVGVQHRADHVGQAPQLGVRIRRLRQGRAERAQVADLQGERLGLLGEPVDACRYLRRHRVEGLCEAADLVAALRRQLLVQVAVGDRGRGGGQAPQRLADRLGDDHADDARR